MQRDLDFVCDGARSKAPQQASRQKKPTEPTAIPGVLAMMELVGVSNLPKAAPTE